MITLIIETSELWRKDWQLVNAVGFKKNWAMHLLMKKKKESDGQDDGTIKWRDMCHVKETVKTGMLLPKVMRCGFMCI